MKLPYRLGDSFALPLGNGQFAPSCIVQCEHRVVVIRIAIGEESWLDLRVSDDALVLHRWKRDGRVTIASEYEPNAQNVYWMHAARAERIAAAATGAPHPRARRVRVREIRDETTAELLASLDDDCVVSLTHPVSSRTLERMKEAIFNHPGITLRLNNRATEHLDAIAETPVERLMIAGPVNQLPALPSVRHVDVMHPVAVDAIARACPNADSVRLAAREWAIHLRELQPLQKLQKLDLSVVEIVDTQAFAQLSQLKALRLNRVTGLRHMDPIASLQLRTLAVEHLHELERVDALERNASLEQLELVGLWQFEIADMQWALDRERLVRAEIDIGGRRKNLELYRRARWAYPWNF